MLYEADILWYTFCIVQCKPQIPDAGLVSGLRRFTIHVS